MNPAAGGNASGLVVACTFDNAGVSSAITIQDYPTATWHYGAARSVAVSALRTGAAPGTPSGNVIQFCATNNTVASVACAGSAAAAGAAAGNLALSAADVNHSIEAPTSSTTLTGLFITPGSYITCVGAACVPALPATRAKLSKPVLATGPWPNCAAYVSGCASMPTKVLVSTDTGRTVTDGVTAVSSATVTSATANFKAADVGMSVSGGDLPDGAHIATVNSATSVTLNCAGCVGGFTGVTAATAQVIALSPANPPTSHRYVTNGSGAGTRVLTGGSAEFASSDIGLPINFVPAIPALAGARVGTVAADGSTATIAGAGAANIPAGAKKFVIGLATKTAPSTGDTQATLALLLRVNPAVSPTSPPCAANKTSGFQIPLTWRNPQGTTTLATNIAGAVGYNTFIGGNHLSGVSPATVSIAQLDFRTASTSFSGYVSQDYTTTASVAGPSDYRVIYTFLPVGVGVCAGTGTATTWNFSGLTLGSSADPSFTGGGGGGARGIESEPQGTSQLYTGQPLSATSGAYVTTGAVGFQPTNSNACTVSSPALIQIGC